MMALSIRQPWAHAILHLGKDVENRTWQTTMRGAILIHASRRWTPKEVADLEWIQRNISEQITADAFEFGGIIGMVNLVDCVDHSRSRWFSGPYGFVLEYPERLPFRPLKGKLGFFPVDV